MSATDRESKRVLNGHRHTFNKFQLNLPHKRDIQADTRVQPEVPEHNQRHQGPVQNQRSVRHQHATDTRVQSKVPEFSQTPEYNQRCYNTTRHTGIELEASNLSQRYHSSVREIRIQSEAPEFNRRASSSGRETSDFNRV